MNRDLVDEIRKTTARIRTYLAEQRRRNVYLAGSSKQGKSTMHRRLGIEDNSLSGDLTVPDDCPECGFGPDRPELEADDSDELLEARARRLTGNVDGWRTTTTAHGDGVVQRECPDCSHVLDRVHVPEGTSMYAIPQDAAEIDRDEKNTEADARDDEG